MSAISIKQLLEAGVHFGHQTSRWNPKMKEFIFGERNGIHIVDLQQTLKLFKEAVDFLYDLGVDGKEVLFVGTKRQAQEAIEEDAKRCGMHFVTNRWLGGLLTNFTTIRNSIKRYKQLETMKADGSYKNFSKKEVAQLERERKKLDKNLRGIRDMEKLPDSVSIIDTDREAIAVKEASRLGIPVIAIVDTNCNPDLIDYVIPGNDDALRSVKLFTSTVSDAIHAGRNVWETRMEEERLAKEEAEKAEAAARAAREAARLARKAEREKAEAEKAEREKAEAAKAEAEKAAAAKAEALAAAESAAAEAAPEVSEEVKPKSEKPAKKAQPVEPTTEPAKVAEDAAAPEEAAVEAEAVKEKPKVEAAKEQSEQEAKGAEKAVRGPRKAAKKPAKKSTAKAEPEQEVEKTAEDAASPKPAAEAKADSEEVAKAEEAPKTEKAAPAVKKTAKKAAPRKATVKKASTTKPKAPAKKASAKKEASKDADKPAGEKNEAAADDAPE